MSMENIKSKLRLTIGTKLVGLIALLLMGSVTSLIFLSTRMFIEDNTALIQQMNSDTAGSLATQMRELFTNLTEKMRVMGTVMNEGSSNQEKVVNEFFAKDKEFLAVFMYNQ